MRSKPLIVFVHVNASHDRMDWTVLVEAAFTIRVIILHIFEKMVVSPH